MYACGVTVYDDCHVGHARAAFIFDFIRKYLIFKNYNLTYVRNITDVDDKIINKAREEIELEGKSLSRDVLQKKMEEVALRYTQRFYADMQTLGIDKADIEPKATEHIGDIIEMIRVLIEKGYAYEADGDVYFEVKKFEDYGKLSNQGIEQMRSGVRKESERNKKDDLDFALWKKSEESEPAWKSPWSEGRPGWHIECSVMSMKYLGESFDIHAGGRDLIFPHHENEIAQSEAATGKPFAKYWIHNGLLTINGEKMAKSQGNFVTIKEILSRYDGEDLKMFFLGSHYSSPIDFTFEKLDAVHSARQRFNILFKKIDEALDTETIPTHKTAQDEEIVAKIKNFVDELYALKQKFEEAMDDDFNTPSALSIMFEIVSLANKFLEEDAVPLERKKPALKTVKFALIECGRVFGLFNFREGKADSAMLADRLKQIIGGLENCVSCRGDLKAIIGAAVNEIGKSSSLSIEKLMEKIIELRDYARSKKDFALSDKIRASLKAEGIILEDTKGKTTWRKE